MNNIHAEVDEILRTGNKKAIVSLFLSMQGNYIRATEAEAKLAEARAEIERLKNEHEDSLRRAKDNAVSLSGAVTEYAGELLVKGRLIEQMREALRLALPEARSTHCERTILAALAAERGE